MGGHPDPPPGPPPRPAIHLAFRFHANLVHSYRGDSDDEAGFGTDIRVIRHVLDVLDRCNDDGIPVRATWDVDNHFSLAGIVPRHCPDVLEAWQRRVSAGLDEVEPMAWNNGLLPAHTSWELDQAMGRALRNDEGSGLHDLFGEVAPIARPQEMMFTPSHLARYPRHGITAVSLFYSAVPFNAFSAFVEPLSLVERFNPLTLTAPGVDGSLTLVPAHNHGDVAEQVSLRSWVRGLRRRQLALAEPTDLLLLIDADADDEFWVGVGGLAGALLRPVLALARGLEGLVRTVADLDFVVFTTPGRYLADHPPVGQVRFGQDTADGSFDGFASWAEKWSNHRLWSGIERSRLLEAQAGRVLAAAGEPAAASAEVAALLERGREARLRSLSTTHFGLSSPVVNAERLAVGASFVDGAVRAPRAALARAEAALLAGNASSHPAGEHVIHLLDHRPEPAGGGPAGRAVLRVPLRGTGAAPGPLEVVLPGGRVAPAALARRPTGAAPPPELLLPVELPEGAAAAVVLRPAPGSRPSGSGSLVRATAGELAGERLSVRFDGDGQVASLQLDGEEVGEAPVVGSWVTFAGRSRPVRRWRLVRCEVLAGGTLGLVHQRGRIPLPGGAPVLVERTFLLAAGLPAVQLDVAIAYPPTRRRRPPRRSELLGQRWDERWGEVAPAELRPALEGRPERPLRVWKRNHLGDVSHYDLDHGERAGGGELDSVNNHVTNGWVAVSDRRRGVLVAQSPEATTCFAFAPLRTRRVGSATRVRINPFGSYHGRQLRHPTERWGLGRFAALHLDTTCRPLAPSYGGRTEHLALLLAPYVGDAPPPQVRADAELFAHPPAVVSASPLVGEPPHRRWALGAPG